MSVHLDGNAAGGLLSEVFAGDMTAALGTCAHCGTRGTLGQAMLYPGGPGVVLRCAACTAVIMRVARIRDRLVVDMHGLQSLELQ